MLIISRCRLKESVMMEDMSSLNQWLDEEFLPAYTNVEGINSVQAYNSNNGDIVFIIDADSYASQDNVYADRGITVVASKWFKYLYKSGEEFLLDRPTLQELLTPDS